MKHEGRVREEELAWSGSFTAETEQEMDGNCLEMSVKIFSATNSHSRGENNRKVPSERWWTFKHMSLMYVYLIMTSSPPLLPPNACTTFILEVSITGSWQGSSCLPWLTHCKVQFAHSSHGCRLRGQLPPFPPSPTGTLGIPRHSPPTKTTSPDIH